MDSRICLVSHSSGSAAAAVVVAIGTYFEGLLGTMLDERQCTADDIRRFLRDIESGVLEAQGPAEK
jgi:hypothetical protein